MAPKALNSEGMNCLMVPASFAAATSLVCRASTGPLTAEMTCRAQQELTRHSWNVDPLLSIGMTLHTNCTHTSLPDHKPTTVHNSMLVVIATCNPHTEMKLTESLSEPPLVWQAAHRFHALQHVHK